MSDGLGVPPCTFCHRIHIGPCAGEHQRQYIPPMSLFSQPVVPTPTADDLARRAYATAAVTGLLSAHTYADYHLQSYALQAFNLADAMLAEQKKREAR